VSADVSPHVTVIGDSVLTAVLWNQAPLATLEQGFDVDMEVGVCRTLTGSSCPFEGSRVPTLVDLAHTLGPRLGATVVVELGYNDSPGTFAQSVEQSVAALLAAGVERILWVNLHEWRPQYSAMNHVLDQAARRYPEMTILDWRTSSQNKWSWFQGDGVHLTYAGAMAMAAFLHGSIMEGLARLTFASSELPAAVVGRPYDSQLIATGGIPPYRFSETGTRLHGLRLLASGRLYGTPTKAGQVDLLLQVTDSFGYSSTQRQVLTVRQPNP